MAFAQKEYPIKRTGGAKKQKFLRLRIEAEELYCNVSNGCAPPIARYAA